LTTITDHRRLPGEGITAATRPPLAGQVGGTIGIASCFAKKVLDDARPTEKHTHFGAGGNLPLCGGGRRGYPLHHRQCLPFGSHRLGVVTLNLSFLTCQRTRPATASPCGSVFRLSPSDDTASGPGSVTPTSR
jgi:hypothetical protein